MNNKPKLRFKEFDNEWFCTDLEQICDIYDGTHQTPNYKDSGIQFLSVENIKDIDASSKFISEEDFRKDFKIKPELNDILMTRIGDIGTPALIKNNKNYAYYVSLALLKCKKEVFPSYLLQAITNDNFQRQLWKNTLHVAFPKKINKGDIGKCKIKYPLIQEQQKIAEFLSKVDEIIAEREEEVKDLEQQKKGLMQKIFSQQLRFTDSNNRPYPDWEEKIIADVFSFLNGKAHEQDIDNKGEYIVVNSKFISSDGIVKKYTNKIICPLKKNDIVLVMSDVPNGKAMSKCYLIDKDNTYSLNQRICCLRTKEIAQFYIYQVSRNKYFLKFDNGVSQTNLRKEDVLKCPVLVPCLEEQEKIANLLSKMDELIEEKKSLLSDWQQFKKGLLQQMFA